MNFHYQFIRVIKKLIKASLLLLLIFFVHPLSGKDNVKQAFAGKDLKLAGEISSSFLAQLQLHFSTFSVFQLDHQALYNYTRSAGYYPEFELKLGHQYNWGLKLELNELRSDNYKLTVNTEHGTIIKPRSNAVAYKGIANGDPNNVVRITIHEKGITGLIIENGAEYFIEPAGNFAAGIGSDKYVIYKAKDLITTGSVCYRGPFENKNNLAEEYLEYKSNNEVNNSSAECTLVEIAVACEYSYTSGWGGVDAAEARIISTLNLVQEIYKVVEVEYELVTTYISDCSSCDAWGSTAEAYPLWLNFNDWCENGGLGLENSEYDVASLWTGNDIGFGSFKGTIGFAGNDLCVIEDVYNENLDAKFNVLESGNSIAMDGVDQGHELGHNWSCKHDDNNRSSLMSPVIGSGNTKFSQFSIDQLNSYKPTAAQCTTPGCVVAPSVNFTSDVTSGCGSLTVQFQDRSTREPTSWLWDFGDSSTSTEQNPVHTYAVPGKYTVTLTATNEVGSNTSEKTEMIIVEAGQPYSAQKVGEQHKDIGTGGYAGGGRFMIFDALEDMTLVSIKVYPETTGDIQLAITKNQGGAQIQSTTTFKVTAPEDRVLLNWDLPAGSGYELTLMPSTPVNLYRNQSGATYPHNIDNLISIHSNYWAEQGNPKEGWYIGYDWEVRKKGCTTVVGIREASLNKIKVFPNPGTGVFQLSLPQDLIRTNIDLSLYNINGQLVYSKALQAETAIIPLDITGLDVGTYILKLKSDQWVENIRMTKL